MFQRVNKRVASREMVDFRLTSTEVPMRFSEMSPYLTARPSLWRGEACLSSADTQIE